MEELNLAQYHALIDSGVASKPKLKPRNKYGAGLVEETPESPVFTGKQVILGTCPSKSNCYRISGNTLIKTPVLKQFEDNFFIQCNQYRNANIKGYFEFYVDVFYPNQRADLDNAMKVLLDCLQRVKAIENDRWCVKIVAQKFLDKTNPRIEFSLIKV